MHKIYREPNTDFSFTFHSENLKNSFYAYLRRHNSNQKKRLTCEDLYKCLSRKLYISTESVRKHISGSNAPNDIKIIYGYGEFLENGNRYAFLTLHETDVTFTEKAQDILAYENFAQKCIKAVYSALIKVISEYSASDCFNRTPDDSDALLYYRRKIDKIEAMIRQLHGHDELAEKMLLVTRAIKRMICTCEFPGIPCSWYDINPNLRFYSPGFTLMAKCAEEYERIKSGNSQCLLDYYPEKHDMRQCYEYFANLYKESDENNYHYGIIDFFQQELIDTIKIIFETEIDRYSKSD